MNLPFYTEGPVVDREGNLFCTTLRGGTILHLDKQGNYAEWANSACPNGQALSLNGDHLVCDSMMSAVRRFDQKGNWLKDEIQNQCAGKPVYVPNDLVLDSRDGIYFTDSKRHTGAVFYLGNDGQQFVIADNLDYPNGLVLSGDEYFLYVAESYRNRILKINLSQSVPTKKKVTVLADLPKHISGRDQDNLPDGLAMDNDQNLWVAHYGMQAVQVVSTEGHVLFSIDTGIPYTSNLTFIDDSTLMVTGGYGEPGPGAVVLIETE